METHIHHLQPPFYFTGILPESERVGETHGKRILPYCEPGSLGMAQVTPHPMQAQI